MIIGLSIAAPVGPIGVLCIRRTLSAGRTAGLVSGLGAATADALYGAAAAFGLTALTALLTAQARWLGLVGGAFLLYLGLRTIFSPPAQADLSQENQTQLWGMYASTLALTLANPATILAFMGIYAGLGGAAEGGGLLMVLGVFCGSALWWLSLSWLISLLRGVAARPAFMAWINRLSGAVLCLAGAWAVWHNL